MTTLLLVEDNENNRDMLSRRLMRRGYQIAVAIDGQQGVDLAHTLLPDLILMDMSLPILDGWDATQQIKASAVTQHIPVIALTAHDLPGDRDRCLAVGCDEYATKPIEFPRLLSKVNALLHRAAYEVCCDTSVANAGL